MPFRFFFSLVKMDSSRPRSDPFVFELDILETRRRAGDFRANFFPVCGVGFMAKPPRRVVVLFLHRQRQSFFPRYSSRAPPPGLKLIDPFLPRWKLSSFPPSVYEWMVSAFSFFRSKRGFFPSGEKGVPSFLLTGRQFSALAVHLSRG